MLFDGTGTITNLITGNGNSYFNGGNVGIGTTSPGTKLHVGTGSGATVDAAFQIVADGSAISGIQILSGATQSGRIVFGDSGNNSIGVIKYDHSDNSLQTIVNGSERLRVTSTGNVGIGTTSPTQKLDVVGKIALNDGGNSVYIGTDAGLNDDASDNQNVGVGHQALYSNTTGGANTANGYRALYSNTTGGNNTANGNRALFLNTTGIYNTANGFQALYSNTTGANNTANGYAALFLNTTGASNVANGYRALFLNTTGANNTANGFQALYSNTTANNNVALGHEAAYSNTTGADNVVIGYKAMRASTTSNNNTVIGKQAMELSTAPFSSVAIGLNAMRSGTFGGNNVAVGNEALMNYSGGSTNVAIGGGALRDMTNNNNTAVGVDAGRYAASGGNNTGGSTSVYLGRNARPSGNFQFNQIVIGENAIGIGSNSTTLGNSSTQTATIYGRLGLGTTSPDQSALLDIDSSTQGFLPPRMRQGDRDNIPGPADGLMIWNTDTKTIDVYESGSGWKSLAWL